MKRLVLLLLCALMLSCTSATLAQPYPVVTEAFDWELIRLTDGATPRGELSKQHFTDGWMLVDTDYGEGFLSIDGKVLYGDDTPWQNAAINAEGFGYVEENGMPKMLNLKRKYFFAAYQKHNGKQYRFADIGPCSDGMFRVEMDCDIYGRSTRTVGYLNKDGIVVVDLLEFKWEAGTDFKNGYARVIGYDGRWSIINKRGEIAAALPQGAVPMAVLSDSYVYRTETEYTLASFEKGDICTLGTFSNCTAQDGLYFAEAYEPENNVVFDQKGKVVADRAKLLAMGVNDGGGAPYLPIVRGLEHGMIVFRGHYGDSSGIGYLDREGQMAAAPSKNAARAQNWLIPFQAENELWGLMDIEGSIAVEPQFKKIGPISDGACLVSANGLLRLLRFYWNGKE